MAKYSAEQMQRLLREGQAFDGPNGPSYPCADMEDLQNAIKAVGRGGADHDRIRAFIIGRAKVMGLMRLIPGTWAMDGSLKRSSGEISGEIAQLQGKRSDLMDQLAILASLPGELSAGQAERHENLMRGIGRIDERIAALENTRSPSRGERLQRLQQINGTAESLGPSTFRPLRRVDAGLDVSRVNFEDPASGQQLRSAALACIDNWDHISARQQAYAANLVDRPRSERDREIAWLIVATDHPDYRDAFEIFVRSAFRPDVASVIPTHAAQRWREVSARAMATGVTGQGGAMAPIAFDPAVVQIGAGSVGPWRSGLVPVSTITTNVWHGVTGSDISASWVAESTEAGSDLLPTVGQTAVTPTRAQVYIAASEELLADAVDLVGSLSQLCSDARRILEDAAFVAGTGSNQPTGVVTALDLVTASRVSTQTASTFGLIDSLSAASALPSRYKADAAWIGHETMWNNFRRAPVPANVVSPIPWVDDADADPSALLNGHPVYNVNSMTSSLTTGNDIAIYGDWGRGARIVDVIGLGVIQHPLIGTNGRPTNQSALYWHWRTGFAVVNPTAFQMVRTS
jgi:HK97 family phage major capsid protein